jgi:hypothetical protein
MKKLMTLMLGAGLAFGAVTMFAGQDQPQPTKKAKTTKAKTTKAPKKDVEKK